MTSSLAVVEAAIRVKSVHRIKSFLKTRKIENMEINIFLHKSTSKRWFYSLLKRTHARGRADFICLIWFISIVYGREFKSTLRLIFRCTFILPGLWEGRPPPYANSWVRPCIGFCVITSGWNCKKYHPECTKIHRISGSQTKFFWGKGLYLLHTPNAYPYPFSAFDPRPTALNLSASCPARASSVFEPCRRLCFGVA